MTPPKIKCPKCNSDESVEFRGKRYLMYPAGCLMIIGPFVSIIHQATTPIDYECTKCELKFGKRSTVAKITMCAMILFLLYVISTTFFNTP